MSRRRRQPYQVNELQLRRQLARRAWHAQGGLCYFCQQPVTIAQITADHFVPQYAGGTTKSGNIVAACFPCNNTRNQDETNRRGKAFTGLMVGDDSPRSPFEILADKFPK